MSWIDFSCDALLAAATVMCSNGRQNVMHLNVVWNTRTRHVVAVLKGHTEAIISLYFHPFCPQLLMSSGYDGQINLWDCSRNACIKAFKHTQVTNARFSKNGRSIVFTEMSGEVGFLALGGAHKEVLREQFFNSDFETLARYS